MYVTGPSSLLSLTSETSSENKRGKTPTTIKNRTVYGVRLETVTEVNRNERRTKTQKEETEENIPVINVT